MILGWFTYVNHPFLTEVIWEFFAQRTQNLEEILVTAEIESRHIKWLHQDVSLKPYEVWRQDDNGNQALVKRCDCKSDALILQNEYEDKGHKQLYWVKEIV